MVEPGSGEPGPLAQASVHMVVDVLGYFGTAPTTRAASTPSWRPWL